MGAIPYPNFRDLQKENRTFSAMAISRGFGFSLIGAGEAERVSARLVSADFFSVLGVKPALGRTFAPGEDEPGAGTVVVISADLWQRKFGAAQDVVGKGLTLDDKSYTIIGVLPASFSLFRGTDVYVPIGQWNNPALQSRGAGFGAARNWPAQARRHNRAGAGRPGQSDGEISPPLIPETNKGNGAKVSPLKERMIGDIGPTLWMLLGAVGFVLLIACVNVSNLLLARSTGRTREFAIRAALGAGRWRLLRQSLTESMLLALAGGGLGLAVAGWGTQAALALLPTTLPRASEVGLDARVLIFTLAISLLTGILAGLAPALKTSQWRLSETLKEGGRGASGGRGRAQGVLVAVEMALALVLLIGAGLMIRSLSALWNVDPGFRPDNVLTFGLSLSPSMRTASPEATRADLARAQRSAQLDAGCSGGFILGRAQSPLQGEDDLFFWLEGQPKPASQSEMNMALVYRVEPGYLTAMGIPLKQGRFFTDQDDERSQPVVVIDEVFARKYFGERRSRSASESTWRATTDPLQIVGVVGHVKQWSLDSDDEQTLQAQLYEPFRQFSDNAMTGCRRGRGDAFRGSGVGTLRFDPPCRTKPEQPECHLQTADDERGDRRLAGRRSASR